MTRLTSYHRDASTAEFRVRLGPRGTLPLEYNFTHAFRPTFSWLFSSSAAQREESHQNNTQTRKNEHSLQAPRANLSGGQERRETHHPLFSLTQRQVPGLGFIIPLRSPFTLIPLTHPNNQSIVFSFTNPHIFRTHSIRSRSYRYTTLRTQDHLDNS